MACAHVNRNDFGRRTTASDDHFEASAITNAAQNLSETRKTDWLASARWPLANPAGATTPTLSNERSAAILTPCRAQPLALGAPR
jgi:hypothetical protein